jgi:hypothetical protein
VDCCYLLLRHREEIAVFVGCSEMENFDLALATSPGDVSPIVCIVHDTVVKEVNDRKFLL